MPDGTWWVSGGALEKLTLTGAPNSSDDFTLTFTAYAEDLTQDIPSVFPEPTSVNPEVEGELATDVSDGSIPTLPVQSLGTGSLDIAIIAKVDPFTVVLNEVNLTAEGSGNTTVITGAEDTAIPLDFDVSFIDNDGSEEVLSITLTGFPTLEVEQVTTPVPAKGRWTRRAVSPATFSTAIPPTFWPARPPCGSG